MKLIEVAKVSKSFKKNLSPQTNPVLNNINFTVNEGDFIVLKGENGSGKTTLLNIISGLIKPDSGKVELMGLSPENFQSKLGLGYVLQKTELPDNIKVKELITVWQSYYPEYLSLDEVLEKVDLKDQAESLATDLSGGQKQRLYFALALVGKPRLLILDEPTTGLDSNAYKIFWEQIKLCRQEGKTILMVTHSEADHKKLDDLQAQIVILTKYSKVKDNQPQLNQEYKEKQPSNFICSTDNSSKITSVSLKNLFFRQCWFEYLQIRSKPNSLLLILVYSVIIPVIFKFALSYSEELAYLSTYLPYICGFLLFIIVIDECANIIVIERAKKWLNLIKSSPVPPFIYIGAKLLAVSLICGCFTLIYFCLIRLLDISNYFGINAIVIITLGIIPFALLGIVLAFLLPQENVKSVLRLFTILIPFFCSSLIVYIQTLISDRFSFIPDSLSSDLLVLLPFFHYRHLIDWIINSDNVTNIFLDILWLIWATLFFGGLAIWSFKREGVVQR